MHKCWKKMLSVWKSCGNLQYIHNLGIDLCYSWNYALKQGGEPIHYHGPHKWWIITGGPQKQFILLKNSTFI